MWRTSAELLVVTRPVLALVVIAFVAGSSAAGPLADLARRSGDEFRPIDTARVEAARRRLTDATLRLERFLVPGSDRGERWKQYLEWDGVQQQLADGAEFKPGLLRRTLVRLRQNESGLELPAFQDAADAIETYAMVADLARVSDQEAYIKGQLDQFAKYFERHESAPTPRSRYEIERRLYVFETVGAAPDFVAQVRESLAQPNVHVDVASNVLARLVAEPVNDSGPVTDCILGTSIHGTGITSGTVRAETRPSENGAAIVFVVDGTTHTNTVGYNGPVVIRSDGTTDFHATKQVTFTDETFWNHPAAVSATTNSRTRSVKKRGGGLGSRIIESIARDRVAEQKPKADAIAGDHAEVRIAANLDAEFLPRLRKARGRYEREFQQPLTRVNSKPDLLQFSSTSSRLLATARVHGVGELAADAAPPAGEHDGDIGLRIHESAPANFLSAWIGGATLSQQSVDKAARLDVNLPDWLEDAIDQARAERDADLVPESADEFQPWSIRFRSQRPVSFAFGNGRATVTIHAARIQAGTDNYDDWDISATYELHAQGGQLLLIRDGEIDVLPSKFDPADGGGLTNRQVALRGNLAKEINRLSDNGRGFPDSTEIGPIDLGEDVEKLDLLLFDSIGCENGWLAAVMSLR